MPDQSLPRPAGVHLILADPWSKEWGQPQSLFVWTVFGANMVVPLLQPFNPLAFVYAVLSLTAVRMLPVAVSLIGTRMRPETVLMMGWLGPRGLASVVFTLIVFEAFAEASKPYDTLLAVAGWTILLSVVLHGLSAVPLANWYARRLETADPAAPELVELPELRTRHGHRPSLVDHSQ